MAKNLFSGWKKFSTNGKNTIMAHPSGHKMIVQHKHLKPEHLEQLHALPFAGQDSAAAPSKSKEGAPKLQAFADGGSVPEPDKKNAASMQKGATSGSISASDAWGNLKSGLGLAEGGPVPAPSVRPSNSPNLKENQSLTDEIRDPDLRRTIEMEPRRKGYDEGGQVEPTPTQSPASGDVNTTGEYDPSQDTQINGQKPPAPKGKGHWKWFADGGEVSDTAKIEAAPDGPIDLENDASPAPQSDIDPEIQKKREFYNHETSVPTGRGFVAAPDKQFGADGTPPKNFDPAAAVRANEDYTKAQQNDADNQQQAALTAQAGNQARQTMGLAPLPDAMASAAAKQDPALQAQVAQATAPQTPGDPYGSQAYSDAYVKGVNEQKAGLRQEGAAEQNLGDAQAKAYTTAQENQQQTLNDFQTHYQNLDTERQNLIKDINNQHIDPNHYMGSMDTGAKVSTAVGLIAAGIGGAITGQGNHALTFLNSQIDRDIAAQKANLGKSENLLSANMNQFHNMRDATDMTRVMQTDIISNQLKQEAAKAQGPVAKARLLQAAGQLDQQTAPILSQIAMRKTLLGGMNSGRIPPEQVIRAIVPPKDQEPAYKELKSAQSMINGRDNLLSAFDQLSTLDTVGNRVTSPLQTPKQVNAIKEPLLAQLVKDSEGRITPQDTKMIEAFFPAAGDNAQTQATKRAQMNKFVSEKMSYPLLDAYGIKMGQSGRYTPTGASKFKLGPTK